MKKAILLAALPALMLVSCTNEEDVYTAAAEQTISFDAVPKTSSRGFVSSTDPWSAPIYVASAHKPEGSSVYSNVFGSNPFVKFTRSGGTTGNWVSATDYPYPKNGVINFAAYATGSSAEDAILPDETSTSPKLNRDATDGSIKSIALSFTTTDHTLNGKTEVMYSKSANINCTENTTATSLQFNHALAWVSIEVTEGKDKMYFEDMKLDGIYLTGSVVIEPEKAPNLACTWTPSGTATSFKIDRYSPGAGSSAKLAKDCTVEDGDNYVLAVPVTGATPKIVIKYHMADDATQQTNVLNLGTTTWDAGKHYIYKLSVSLTNIEFECKVLDYGTTDDTPVPL